MTEAGDLRPIGADDLTRLRWAMEPAIDPAGRRLAFVASGPDADHDRLDYSVHVVDISSGDTTPVGAAARTRRPRWAPPSSTLAVLVDIGGRWQVARIDAAGELATVTSLPGNVSAYDWSPDGERIVCEVTLIAVPGGRQVWVVDVADGAAHPLLPDNVGESWAPAWSPSGHEIAVLGGRRGDGTAVWVVDAIAPGKARSVATARGPLRTLAWSPDGRAIAYTGQKTQAAPWANDELWVVDPRDGVEHRLGPTLDRSIGQVVRGDDERGFNTPSLAWSRDGAAVLAAFADGGSSSIASFDASSSGAGWKRVLGGDRAVLEFDVAERSGALAYTWSDPLTPGEVSVRLPDGTEQRCSDLGHPIRQSPLAPTARVSSVADDGQPVEGWLTMPLDPRGSVPLVVQVHGGPHYPVGLRFSFDAQRWAAAGFAVLRGNPRGSQGYGAEFAAAIQGDWGGRDFRDLMGLLDSALVDDRINQNRLAIVGESYGGYVAMWAIGRTDRFAAAVAENGISDLAAAARHSPDFWSAELATAPGEEPARVRERSPLTAAAQVTTPLLAVHAEQDAVSPIRQSEAMVTALHRQGCAAELLRVPGEGHLTNLFGRPSRRIAKLRRIDRFLVDHLGVPSRDRHPTRSLESTAAVTR